MSVYPLAILTIFNNLYTIICCRDSSQAPRTWANIIFFMVAKVIVALLPIFVGMAVSNLVTVLNYAGLIGFFMSYFFPFVLQLRSQWVCYKTFGSTIILKNDEYQKATVNETQPLLVSKRKLGIPWKVFMTPYSTVFSYWPVVIIIGIFCTILFIMTIVGLFL